MANAVLKGIAVVVTLTLLMGATVYLLLSADEEETMTVAEFLALELDASDTSHREYELVGTPTSVQVFILFNLTASGGLDTSGWAPHTAVAFEGAEGNPLLFVGDRSEEFPVGEEVEFPYEWVETGPGVYASPQSAVTLKLRNQESWFDLNPPVAFELISAVPAGDGMTITLRVANYTSPCMTRLFWNDVAVDADIVDYTDVNESFLERVDVWHDGIEHRAYYEGQLEAGFHDQADLAVSVGDVVVIRNGTLDMTFALINGHLTDVGGQPLSGLDARRFIVAAIDLTP